MQEIFPVLSLIVQCCRAQAKIYEQLDDIANAKAMSREALDAQAQIYEYLYSLTKERTLEINRKEKFDDHIETFALHRYFVDGLLARRRERPPQFCVDV